MTRTSLPSPNCAAMPGKPAEFVEGRADQTHASAVHCKAKSTRYSTPSRIQYSTPPHTGAAVAVLEQTCSTILCSSDMAGLHHA